MQFKKILLSAEAIFLMLIMSIFIYPAPLKADTLYLKNGHKVEGLIIGGDEQTLDLEVCSGRVKFTKGEIERVEESSPEKANAIREQWEAEKKEAQARLTEQENEKKKGLEVAGFSNESQGIILDVILNKKVKATLVLDTGASLVMLRKNIAEKLGIDLSKEKQDIKTKLVDGRQVDSKYIILDSVQVADLEAENVEAAILLDDLGGADIKDGLLGASFLKRFNFKIDFKNKKLSLEKL